MVKIFSLQKYIMENFYQNLEKNTILFENSDIHVIIDDNNDIWFNANDITTALGYINTKNTVFY